MIAPATWYRGAASLLAAASGWFAAISTDRVWGLELGSGYIGGPFIVMAALGGALLLAAALVLWFRPRVGRLATMAGMVLVLPWASWLFAPGLWCLTSTCSAAYPLVTFAPGVLLLAGCPFLSWTIQRRYIPA